MDDIYAIGPPEVVFPSVERFLRVLQQMTGLEIQAGKSSCWSRDYDLATCPWRTAWASPVPVGSITLPAAPGVAHGVMVGFHLVLSRGVG